MRDYRKSKIYKIINSVDNSILIGSTCSSLHVRLSQIKTKRQIEHFNAIGWDKMKIILIEEYPCKNKDELTREEQNIIDSHKKAGYTILNDTSTLPEVQLPEDLKKMIEEQVEERILQLHPSTQKKGWFF